MTRSSDHSLLEPLLKIANGARGSLPAHNLLSRPLFFLSPRSSLASFFIPIMLRSELRVVAGVDVNTPSGSKQALAFDILTPESFTEKAKNHSNALAVDFSNTPKDLDFYSKLCQSCQVERIDFVAALDELKIDCIYQLPSVMRDVTLARFDEFISLSGHLDDALSRETLYAMLLLRLTYDRRWLKSVLIQDEPEYFSDAPNNRTFSLRENEIFCDAGAYVGTTVSRFIEASRGKYRAIHAFEPDRSNFRRLQDLANAGSHDLSLYNLALADRNEIINFQEVGTMGSHLTRGGRGNSSIEAVRLDDKLDAMTFLKMDVEGGEALAINGARRLLSQCTPRLAITVYHYAHDLVEVPERILNIHSGYRFRLRQHACYYFDMVLYGQVSQ